MNKVSCFSKKHFITPAMRRRNEEQHVAREATYMEMKEMRRDRFRTTWKDKRIRKRITQNWQ